MFYSLNAIFTSTLLIFWLTAAPFAAALAYSRVSESLLDAHI